MLQFLEPQEIVPAQVTQDLVPLPGVPLLDVELLVSESQLLLLKLSALLPLFHPSKLLLLLQLSELLPPLLKLCQPHLQTVHLLEICSVMETSM